VKLIEIEANEFEKTVEKDEILKYSSLCKKLCNILIVFRQVIFIFNYFLTECFYKNKCKFEIWICENWI
jgi:hypothetical protein